MSNHLINFCRSPRKYFKYFHPGSLKATVDHVRTRKNFRMSEILDEIYLYHERRLNPGEAMPMDPDELMAALKYFLKVKLKQFLGNADAKLSVPAQETPVVSILLVLYNKAEYTYQCLETILANADLPYEVVIVDNASSDATPQMLERVENATIIRNEENVGFLKACNQGARHARGQWLLLLNNDTQVLPGLLSSLVATTTAIDKCGAVGGKLIFPNGTLQEAGSIIWKNGSCLGYGRGDDPDKPQYSYLKEVDYCSGACLLVDRELFDTVGGFDERYFPAYYEETDLCMKIRQAGYKVIYQPAAKLIHYEFGSSGSSEKAIELQMRNREKFATKWSSALADQYQGRPANIIHARERLSSAKRVLILEDRFPDPNLGSGFPRIYEIIQILADIGLRITFFPLVGGERPEPYTSLLQQRGIEVYYATEDHELRLAELLKERKSYYDAIWVSRPHNMRNYIDLIKGVCPKTEVIYDAEALFSLRTILQHEVQGEPLDEGAMETKIREEIDLIKQADRIVTVSQREADLIRRYTDAGTLHVLGHTYAPNPTPRSFDERRDILFVGGFLTSPSPNEDAILHFVKEIFPLIREKIDARLWIVGTNRLESIRALASEEIMVTGRVECLFEYYDSCRVFVVPTRYAAGIPFKLQECLNHGLPAVASPLIAEQLGLGEDTLLAGASAAEFAKKVVAAYTDESLWCRLRENGLAYIGRECSSAGYREVIREIFT